MNTWNKFLRFGLGTLVMLCVAALFASNATAQGSYTTPLPTVTFSSAIPATWTNDGSWYYSANGNGGSNGSAACDIYDYYSPQGRKDKLTTASLNVSAYGVAADSIWVDFDFCFEHNEADQVYGDDGFEVDANSDALLTGSTTALQTYSNNSSYGYDVNPPISSSNWRHYHLLVPISDRTSTMTITFEGIAGPYGATNPAIDNVTINGFLLPPTELALETIPAAWPKTMNFGTATPNSPDTLYATVASVGVPGTTLNILGYGISGPGASSFKVISGPGISPPGIPQGSPPQQYGIQFQPFSSGIVTATFTLATNGVDSGTQSIALTGIGAIPTVSYNGTRILFQGTHIELTDTSGVKYVHVTSNGVGPLTFKSIFFAGLNPSSYIITYLPQNPLPTGVTDSIGIRFAPQIEGEPDARLVINTTAANIPSDTVLMEGFGILPHLAVGISPPGTGNTRTANTVAFDSVAMGDSVCQTVTLTNPGSDTVVITHQIVTYGDYDFTFYPLTGIDTLIAPGASQLVNVCFKPAAVGTREATLRFFTNIPGTITTPPVDTSQFIVSITGIGVPYGELVVTGPVVDTAIVGGTSHCITDTLANVGLADLTVTSATLTGPNTAAWTVNAVTPLTIPAGTHVLVQYCYTASARGKTVDTLSFAGASSSRPFTTSLPLTGVGAITCASAAPMNATFGATKMTLVGSMDTTCITVTNCGDIAASYTAALVSAGYTLLSKSPSASVAGGGTTEFCVEFGPTAIGAASGMLTVTGGPTPIADTLSGVGAGVTATATGSLAKLVTLGMCDSFAVTITNNGNVAWTPGAGMISGANAGDFTISSGPTPAVVAAGGGTAVVMIKFCPTMAPAGQESMTLTFPSENPVPLPTAFSYAATASGTSAGVAIKTEQDGFVLGQSYPNPNNGTADVMVTLPQDARVQIDLLDLTGALVETAFTGSLPSGDQIVHIDAKGIPSGTYFYTLTSGDVRLTRELILLK